MDIMEQLGACGLVPVVVIEDANNAVPTAKALLAGGVNVMEITFRTAAAPDAIKAVAENCPDMLVGAGTILTVEQATLAVECGAKFIVSPGFDQELVEWCIGKNVPVVPGCVTPSEIMQGLKLGLKVLKFFPANVYGGLSAMKALAGPFGGVKFIPTCGVSQNNIGEFVAAPFIHAVGGSWVCPKADISAGNFEKITQLTQAAVEAMHGFTLAHIGINCEDNDAAQSVAGRFGKGFNLPIKDGNSSVFAGSGVEVMKTMFRGENGHIAFHVNNVSRAVAYLQQKGFTPDFDSAKYKNGNMTVIYLNDEVGGFAIHLLQK